MHSVQAHFLPFFIISFLAWSYSSSSRSKSRTYRYARACYTSQSLQLIYALIRFLDAPFLASLLLKQTLFCSPPRRFSKPYIRKSFNQSQIPDLTCIGLILLWLPCRCQMGKGTIRGKRHYNKFYFQLWADSFITFILLFRIESLCRQWRENWIIMKP